MHEHRVEARVRGLLVQVVDHPVLHRRTAQHRGPVHGYLALQVETHAVVVRMELAKLLVDVGRLDQTAVGLGDDQGIVLVPEPFLAPERHWLSPLRHVALAVAEDVGLALPGLFVLVVGPAKPGRDLAGNHGLKVRP